MPRIAVCLNYADRDNPRFSGENLHLDYCADCYQEVDISDIAESRQLPDDAVDCGVEHPDYVSWDYTCERCHKRLTEEDN